jgi:hypothetical protein
VLDKPRSPAAIALGELADSILGTEAQADAPVEQEHRRRSWRRTDKEASGQ